MITQQTMRRENTRQRSSVGPLPRPPAGRGAHCGVQGESPPDGVWEGEARAGTRRTSPLMATRGVAEHAFIGVGNPVTSCLVYDPGPTGGLGGVREDGDIVQRAGTLLHEAWHAHLRGEGFDSHNEVGCENPEVCDRYVPDLKTRAPGALWQDHSKRPFQLEQELYCDIMDYAEPFVPLIVQAEAAAEFDTVSKLVSATPYSCGSALPLGVQPMNPNTCPTGQAQCVTSADCSGTDVCVSGCCDDGSVE